MSTITRERLEQLANFRGAPVTRQEEQELARIALASLEAERVGCDACGGNGSVGIDHGEMGIEHIECPKCYTAPPAPASADPVAWLWSHRKHPSEVTLVRPEDDERADGAHWSGWSCQALYAAPPAPVAVPDESAIFEAAIDICRKSDAIDEHAWNRGVLAVMSAFRACRAAMLQGADGNSPVIPDGWVMLPAEPTQAMMNAWLSEVANWRGHAAGYRAMIAAAPQQEAKNV